MPKTTGSKQPLQTPALDETPLPVPSFKAPKLRDFLPPLDVHQRYSIDESLAYLRTSRGTLFGDIREGRLKVIKEGKRTYVPGSEIARRSSLSTAA